MKKTNLCMTDILEPVERKDAIQVRIKGTYEGIGYIGHLLERAVNQGECAIISSSTYLRCKGESSKRKFYYITLVNDCDEEE